MGWNKKTSPPDTCQNPIIILFFFMNCWHCQTKLIWGGDHDFEDYGAEGEGIVSNLSCPNKDCNAFVLVYLPFEKED